MAKMITSVVIKNNPTIPQVIQCVTKGCTNKAAHRVKDFYCCDECYYKSLSKAIKFQANMDLAQGKE